ncbi:MAG TPA: TIGR03118 family protein [Burkholderiaceae bacterium]|nr:TIGR03118 family protein [Burkholderiaceae bacterium]
MGALLLLAACGGGDDDNNGMSGYAVTNLVTDTNTSSNPYATSNVDTHLVNPWGIAFNPQGFVWVANNATSTSTLYDGNGMAQSLIVAIPAGTAGPGKPTGIVYNGTQSFVVSQGGLSGASRFVFAGESGTIAAWSPNVDLNNAIKVYDGASAGSIYKGLAIGSASGADRLFAADFHNAAVDTFDATFAKISAAGGFTDPNLPSGYAPFGIQVISGVVYVTYAKQDADAEDDVKGAGLGLVNTFDTAGHFLKRLITTGGALNAPWGIAMAPSNFGKFSGALLIGNFGDGRINAYDASTGALMGPLTKTDGNPIVVDGLWGIAFGNGINGQPTNTLFFAAGPADEAHGVYGRIDVR